MEATSRTLRPKPIAPGYKSSAKAYKPSTTKKAARKPKKPLQKPMDDEAEAPQPTKRIAALLQAKEYLDEASEEEVVQARLGKRAREGQDDEEEVAAEIVAEAQAVAEERFLDDKYIKIMEGRQQKAANDLQSYTNKATLAKQLPKGPIASSKQLEIKNKLSSIHKLIKVVAELTKKRQDLIFDEALIETAAKERARKKRRTNTDEYQEDPLEVSDG
jgi:hypothetical protein